MIRARVPWRLIYLGIVATLIFIFLFQWTYDDPFITYRYAENLSLGRGFVYNIGEQVQSTTSPLFAILLAILGKAWHDLPTLANALGAIGLALGALFLYDLSLSWGNSKVGWTALLLYPTFPLLVHTVGSEMPLYLAFSIGAFAAHARQRHHLTALLAALAVLTRPDGALVSVILAASYLLRSPRRIPWRSLCLFLAMVLPWFIFSWVYFGSPLPATLFAKQQQGGMLASRGFVPGLLTILTEPQWRVGYWLEAGLALLSIVFSRQSPSPSALFLVWPVFHFIAYSLLGVSAYFWYYASLVPGFVLATGLGLFAFVNWWGRLRDDAGPPGRWFIRRPSSTLHISNAGLVGGIAVLLMLAVLQGRVLVEMRQSPDNRVAIYRAVGHWLEAYTPRQSMVGTLEAGVIGYYSRRRLVDFAGLVEPDVAARLKADATYEQVAIWAVEHFHPDYLVVIDQSFRRLERGYVAQYCSLAVRFSGEQYQFPASLSVYSCEWSPPAMITD